MASLLYGVLNEFQAIAISAFIFNKNLLLASAKVTKVLEVKDLADGNIGTIGKINIDK